MNNSLRKISKPHLHEYAAYGTWLMVFGFSIVQLWSSHYLVEAIAWQLLILGLLGLAVNPKVHETRPFLAKSSFVAMLAVFFVLFSRIPMDYSFIYSIIWIAISPHFFKASTCWLSLVLISLAWWVIHEFVWHDQDAVRDTLMLTTFFVFALMSSNIALQSQQANERTQLLNRELLATQHLLAEASKTGERTRIAREIHDLLGHHLTALTINLQVAGRITQGEAKDKIDQCHGLAKLLLSDVREAVSTLRDAPAVDLEEVLVLAISDIPGIKISLQFDPELNLDDVVIAEVLLRSVQEAITNSLKHGKAKTAQITVNKTENAVSLNYSDNGVGVDVLLPGNGLTGMTERVEKLGGSIQFLSTPSMQIELEIPLPKDELSA